MWLDRVRKQLGSEAVLNWRSFVLEQANNKEAPEWKAWEQGEEYESRGLLPLRAGEAARRQGEDQHWKFVLNLLEAKHVDRADIREREAVLDAARASGLDVDRFEKDLDDPEVLRAVARDHETAAEQGVFGTPTFVFEGAAPAFLKMYTPPEDQTMEVWGHFAGLATGARFFGELKRPQPPWPKGVFDDS